jgi:hypothetical protein
MTDQLEECQDYSRSDGTETQKHVPVQVPHRTGNLNSGFRGRSNNNFMASEEVTTTTERVSRCRLLRSVENANLWDTPLRRSATTQNKQSRTNACRCSIV